MTIWQFRGKAIGLCNTLPCDSVSRGDGIMNRVRRNLLSAALLALVAPFVRTRTEQDAPIEKRNFGPGLYLAAPVESASWRS